MGEKDQWPSVVQLARRFDVSEAVILRLAMRGDLQPVRIGRGLRFDPKDVAAFVERNRIVVPNDADPQQGSSGSVVTSSPGDGVAEHVEE